MVRQRPWTQDAAAHDPRMAVNHGDGSGFRRELDADGMAVVSVAVTQRAGTRTRSRDLAHRSASTTRAKETVLTDGWRMLIVQRLQRLTRPARRPVLQRRCSP